jgi:hypothetical protein
MKEFDRTRKLLGVIEKKTDSGKNLLLVKVFGIIMSSSPVAN